MVDHALNVANRIDEKLETLKNLTDTEVNEIDDIFSRVNEFGLIKKMKEQLERAQDLVTRLKTQRTDLREE